MTYWKLNKGIGKVVYFRERTRRPRGAVGNYTLTGVDMLTGKSVRARSVDCEIVPYESMQEVLEAQRMKDPFSPR